MPETKQPRLVSAAGIKEFVQTEVDKDARVAGDLADGVQAKVENLIKDAAARAKANGRTTIRPDDL